MPNQSTNRLIVGRYPLLSASQSYQINGGDAIAPGATITDTVSFTGLSTADSDNVAIAPRNLTLPYGLVLAGLAVTANNTLTVSWRNASASPLTPPASTTWTCVVSGAFFK